MQSKVEPSTRKERLLTLNAGTKKAQNISIFWLTLSPSTWLFYALEIRTAVPSGFTEFIAKTQSAVNEILHAATAVSPRATSQGTAMFSLITAMDWPSFFLLNANAVGQSKQGKRDCYNKLHCLWISYCYLFDTIRTSGKRPLVLALFTSKNALDGDKSRRKFQGWQCFKWHVKIWCLQQDPWCPIRGCTARGNSLTDLL